MSSNPGGRRVIAVMKVSAYAALVVCAGASGGCDTAGQGAVSGATVGALSGLAIGSLSGNAGKGAAMGAVIGGAGGMVIGDQNRRAADRSAAAQRANQQARAAQATAPSDPRIPAADRDRLALVRFARAWNISGWQTVDGERRLVSGTAAGAVENAYFVTLDIRVQADESGQVSAGDVWFASEPGRGVTVNSRFDTSPMPVSHTGSLSPDGNVFTFNETTPGVTGRRMVIRFLSDGEFVVDNSERISGNWTPIGSLAFSAAR
jgi:hypothetical protein